MSWKFWSRNKGSDGSDDNPVKDVPDFHSMPTRIGFEGGVEVEKGLGATRIPRIISLILEVEDFKKGEKENRVFQFYVNSQNIKASDLGRITIGRMINDGDFAIHLGDSAISRIHGFIICSLKSDGVPIFQYQNQGTNGTEISMLSLSGGYWGRNRVIRQKLSKKGESKVFEKGESLVFFGKTGNSPVYYIKFVDFQSIF